MLKSENESRSVSTNRASRTRTRRTADESSVENPAPEAGKPKEGETSAKKPRSTRTSEAEKEQSPPEVRAMSSGSDVYSNAFNFSSYQDGSTDLRTGQFSSVVNLATIRPQGACDASREIKLVFSTLSSTNKGYGIGWRLANTEFNLSSLVLTLASGETYTANPLPPAGNPVSFRDLKLKNLVVVRTDSSTLTVYYIDGTVEVLRRPTPNDLYRTITLTFENGETFQYSYMGTGALNKITHVGMARDVVTFIYSFGALDRVRVLAQGNRTAEIAFTASNELITSITVPYDNTSGTANPTTQPKYIYTYKTTSQGYKAITEIRNPMGGSQRVSYQDNGLKYYNNTYLPMVVVCETTPGAGQLALIKRYNFSTDFNFTGYPYTNGFQQGTDNLYRVTGAYEYWGEETTIDPDANNAVIERGKSVFNKFHLMARRENQRGTALTTEVYTYNENPALSFANQPANLQVPRQVDTTYKNTSSGLSRLESIVVKSDDYGNVTEKIEPSGIKYNYEYYPIGGDGANCPPEPNGFFVRFCRKETITAAAGGGDPKITDVTYTSVSRVSGGSYFVLEKTRTLNSGLVSTNQYENDTARPAVHGRIASSVVTIGGKITSTHFTYVLTGSDLEQTRRMTGHDGTVTSSSHKFCTITQLLLQTWKAGETSVVFTYDVIGRVLSQTVAPGTSNAAANSYVYHFSPAPGSPAWLEETDARGKRYLTRYDGMGRLISAAEALSGGGERRIKALSYDRLGNKSSETIYDQLEAKELSLLSRYEYNGWNELARTIQPDGSVSLSERDMVANTLTTGIQGLNTTINAYNAFNKVAEVTQVSTSGQRLTTLQRSYDGFGRCTSMTNVNQLRTEYSYDSFNRVSQMRMQPAGSSPVRTIDFRYASFSCANLATEVSVNGVVLGKRVYDGVGRMISSANGQAPAWTFAYAGEATTPSSTTSPRGIRLTYNYNPNLGALTEVASPNDGVSRFTHNPTTSEVTEAINNTANRLNTYDQYGSLQSERVTLGGQTSETAYSFSPAGRPMQVTTPIGGTLAQSYDDAGRPSRSSGSGYTEDNVYDQYGRVISVRASLAGVTLETTLTFDGYGREETRTFKLQGNTWQTVRRSYSAGGQLTERRTTEGTGGLISLETFGYDAYSRLISFACSGSNYPSDSQGRKVKVQAFSYDSLDNITRVESVFLDESSNVSTRGFSSVIPTQLIQINETNPAGAQTLTYDADGNLTRDHRGRTYTYDQFGRLKSSSQGGVYGYDADGRLLAQTPAGAPQLDLFYANDLVAGQRQGATSASFHRMADPVHARTIQSGSSARSEVNALDTTNSVIGRFAQDGGSTSVMYTPYGESSLNAGVRADDLAAQPSIAFNGQYLDALANLYHLGNGRRAYSPELMIFLSPDPMAPFGKGGLNAYAYCGGDPINMVDPTGLMSTGANLGWSIFGLLLAIVVFAVAVVAAIPTGGASLSLVALAGAIGAGLGVVSATLGVASAGVSFADEQNGWDRSGTASNLGIASLAFGIASAVVGLASAAGAGVTAVRSRGAYSLTKALGGQVSDVVAAAVAPAERAVASTAQKFAWGFSAAAKSFVGLGETVIESMLGVTNFVNGMAANVVGVIGVVDLQTGSDGSNGGTQGETQLASPNNEREFQGDPNKASTPAITDPITSLADFSAEFKRAMSLTRQSLNEELYYGAAQVA